MAFLRRMMVLAFAFALNVCAFTTAFQQAFIAGKNDHAGMDAEHIRRIEGSAAISAGVPPASFLVDGSQGPPCDPKLISIVRQPSPTTARAASAAGRLRSNAETGKVELCFK
jgi:hypothetical protein